MTELRSPAAGRLLALAGILLSAFNLRTAVTSLTPLLDALGATFGFGSTMAGVFGMLPTACFALFGVATPGMAARIGLERTALLSMALAAAGLLLRSMAVDTWGLMAGSVLALAGMGIGNVVLPPLVKRYFPARVGLVSTLYITILQLGTMLPALLAVPLAQAAGWRVSLGIWSLLAIAAALAWCGMLLRSRSGATTPSTAHGGPASADASVAGIRLWRSSLAWGMTLMFGMTSLISYAMFTWLPTIMTEAGASPAFGGTMVALFSALGLASSLAMPMVAVRMRNPFLLVLACASAYAVAFPGLLFAPMAAPVLWVTLLGIGPATFPLSLTLINRRTSTPLGSSRLSGFMQGVGYAMSCAGPLLVGILHDAGHGWGLPFAFLSLCALLMLVGAWQACLPRMLEDAANTAPDASLLAGAGTCRQT